MLRISVITACRIKREVKWLTVLPGRNGHSCVAVVDQTRRLLYMPRIVGGETPPRPEHLNP